MLESTCDIWKQYKCNSSTCNSGWCCVILVYLATLLEFIGLCWCWSLLTMLCDIGLPCHSFLIMVCHDFIEGKAPKSSGNILAFSHYHTPRPIGRVIWCLLDWIAADDSWMVFANGFSYCCWFMWTELLIFWQHTLELPQRTISRQVHILLWPIYLSILLPLVRPYLALVWALKTNLSLAWFSITVICLHLRMIQHGLDEIASA